jgi:hypothetical protein
MAELWQEPTDIASRDLYWGPGGREHAPVVGDTYTFVKRDTTGKSPGFDVKDSKGLVWSVKLGEEAQPEVVVSRILWAVGYHQPPTYHVSRWILDGAPTAYENGAKPPGRFRPELPWQKKVDDWSWHKNPFAGTRPFQGLIALNLLLNNYDFKTSNNKIYELDRPAGGGPRRWYVVRDLGGSLGKMHWLMGKKGDVEEFEEEKFIEKVNPDGRISFEYHGMHREVMRDVTAEDVLWICERLDRITDAQWRDAFRAGGYPAGEANRFIRKIETKIAEGLTLRRHVAASR